MKTIKNLIIAVISILSIQIASAQSSSMKDPVSFKLKNGLTIIVAENKDSKKIYAGFTIDHEAYASCKAAVQEVFNTMMNFSDKGGNVAASPADFANALMQFAKSVQEAVLNQTAFEAARTNVMTSVNARDRYYAETVTEAALKALTLDDIQAYYNRNVFPSNAYLTIAGDITASEAKALAKKSFGEWSDSASQMLAGK